ncbi:Hypothetical predicted protein [Olea europaea subsp. europaea]|uniref:Uncharacterized protein n=1 Tax=Olea europaea subsp. europaea TaxID=158383 RepID=A0A8S0T9C8_OLEEU|nr:Hypothetical predicted protein [Olea europaea subsp. europaea]
MVEQVWNCSEVELLSNSQEHILMKSFVSFKDQNHPKSGVTNPLANDYELFSSSVIYNSKRLLCIPVPDTNPEVLQSKYLFLVQSIELGAMQLIAPLVNGMWTSTTPEEALAILLKEIKRHG